MTLSPKLSDIMMFELNRDAIALGKAWKAIKASKANLRLTMICVFCEVAFHDPRGRSYVEIPIGTRLRAWQAVTALGLNTYILISYYLFRIHQITLTTIYTHEISL